MTSGSPGPVKSLGWVGHQAHLAKLESEVGGAALANQCTFKVKSAISAHALRERLHFSTRQTCLVSAQAEPLYEALWH